MEKFAKFNADIRIVENSVTKLNPQFSLCDILVCYHGDNRNYTSMSKDTINNALYSLYGIPIIGEWLYDTSEETWGSHGGKIIISDSGIEFEETTKPYGFVTKEAADNASWVTITEEDGFTQHEYLQLKGCILWTDRYEEAQSVLKENYGQSMEIEIQDGNYRDDNYFEISKFVFSALCILGTAEPCFESASIGRHYEQSGFEKEMSKMKKAYAKFINERKAMRNEKIVKALGDRYAVVIINDNDVVCVDRQDNYKLLSIPYSVIEGEEADYLIDFENAKEQFFTSTDEPNDFSMAEELNALVESKTQEAVKGYINTQIEEFEKKLQEEEDKYNELLSKYNEALEQIDAYALAEKEAEAEVHKSNIESKLDEYSDKLSKCAEYLIYRANVDYSKSVDEIETDLTLMLGKYAKDRKDKKSSRGAQSYSVYTPKANNSMEQERYGSLLENLN